MDVPVRQLPLDHVWLDYPRRERLLALLLVFDLDEPALTDALAERADELFLGARGPRLGRLGKVELAERLLELATDPVERRVRVGGDHRPDELEREPDRARLERRQARRGAEGVAEDLLPDVDFAVLQLAIDGVAPSAEVDEVQELEVLLQRLGRDVEALHDVGGGYHRLRVLAAAVEQVCEERLEQAEALGWHRARGPLVDLALRLLRIGRDPRQLSLVPLLDELQIGANDPSQLGRGHRNRATVLAEDPRGEPAEVGVAGDEHAVFEASMRAEGTLDPPGRVAPDLDAGLALNLAHLPVRPEPVGVGVEVGRQPEVALAPCREPNVPADARDPEGAHLVGLRVEPDDVPLAAVEEQRVWIDGALSEVLAHDRPVRELHRPVLRDRTLELRQAAGQLGRVARVVKLDRPRGRGRGVLEPGTAEGEVLEREPQRLGVRELPLQQVEARLESRELLVGQLERGSEVALGAQRVELLARELVALRVEWDAEREQLGPVGVEAAREGFVRHLRVALDVLLHVAGGQRPALGHQERDEGELADQLVGVVRHPATYSRGCVATARLLSELQPAARVCNSGREALRWTRLGHQNDD